MKLPNGLEIEILDYSRCVAGDRWLVGLLAKIPIVEVTKEDFEDSLEGEEAYEAFTAQRGNVINFHLSKERNFVDEAEKNEVFGNLLRDLKDHTLSYMGHPDFAARFKRREIKDFMERRKWYR